MVNLRSFDNSGSVFIDTLSRKDKAHLPAYSAYYTVHCWFFSLIAYTCRFTVLYMLYKKRLEVVLTGQRPNHWVSKPVYWVVMADDNASIVNLYKKLVMWIYVWSNCYLWKNYAIPKLEC